MARNLKNLIFTLALLACWLGAGAALAQSPETFLAQATVMTEGTGWKLLEITTPPAAGASAGQPAHAWMVNKDGVEFLPVSDAQKEELKADFAATKDDDQGVILVIKEVADALEATGDLPPGYAASYADASSKSCFGWEDKQKNYDYNFSELSGDWDFNLGGGVEGVYGVNIPLSGVAHLNFKYRVKNFLCAPVRFKFSSARVFGNLEVSGYGDVSAYAGVHGRWEREWKLFEPTIGSFTFYIGILPVRIVVTLPTYAGLLLDVTLVGTVGVQPDFGASGTFDYTCTTSGCSGANTFTDSFNLNNLNLSAQLDVIARAWARVMGRVSIYDDSIGYVEGGLKGLAEADLFGYLGNTCGDADGDGVNEQVRALTADLLWGYDIHYGIGGFLLPDKNWVVTGQRYPLGYRDLLGPGGSTALSPMIIGPAQVSQGSTMNYTVRMRPCYPFTQAVNFGMAPGTWSGTMTIPAPKSNVASENSATVWRSFNTAGPLTITSTATTDAFGRSLQVPFSRTIQVTANTPNAPSALVASATSASSIALSWTDNSNNETGFEIFRRVLPSGSFASVGNTVTNDTTFDDLGLQAATSYEYKVRALNGSAASAYSNTASATTPAAPLAAPSNLAASYDGVARTIRLTWTDNSSTETAFRVQFSYSGSAWGDMSPATVGANVTSYTSGPNPPTGSYQFRVRAENASQSSAWSNTASLVVTTSAPEIRVIQNWDGLEIPDGGAFTFPTTPVASLPISRVFRICNDGNVPLDIANPTGLVSGTGFVQIDVAPATPVQPGACSNFRVRFHVASAGSYTGAVTINNNDANENPYNIALSGVATP